MVTLLRCIFKLSVPAPLRKSLPGTPLPSFLYPLARTAGRRAQGAGYPGLFGSHENIWDATLNTAKKGYTPEQLVQHLLESSVCPLLSLVCGQSHGFFFICIRSWRPPYTALGLHRPPKAEVPRAARSYPRVGSRPLTLSALSTVSDARSDRLRDSPAVTLSSGSLR